ncbi:hypothetical protein [Microbacterium halotolerans]|uniref:hypothetical protein n=1 Tax=Microbacterium halotolerans TaxID=246613 RepID=UPI000E6A9FDC|nr:hypothetical protein [Microbacterium halotolerans]
MRADASGAILATSAVAVRNVFRVRRSETSDRDPLLRWTRAAMIPIVAIGALLAIRISQTGVLLTLDRAAEVEDEREVVEGLRREQEQPTEAVSVRV